MKKAVNITLIAAAFAEIIFCILFIPLGIFWVMSGGYGFGMQEMILVGVIVFVQHFLPVIFKLIAVGILLTGLWSNGRRIWPEILMLILFSGLMSFGSIFINSAVSNAINIMGGVDMIGTYSLMSSGAASVNFLHAVSNSLLIMGACFSIAYKRLLLPFESEN